MHYKTKRKIKYTIWTVLSISFGIVLAIAATQSSGYEKIQKIENNFFNDKIENQEENIQNFYFIKNPEKKLKLEAEAYLIGDLDTGEIILEKNKDSKFPVASVSKLMTATVSLEKQNQDEITTVSKSALATYGKNGGLAVGEKIKIGDLIYPLLLESSNDTAEVLAESSGRNNFLKMMNQKAKDLGMNFTSFEDPSGLSINNKSTPADLFVFAQYLKNEKSALLNLTTKRSYNNKKHIWYNNSQFLGINGYQGGKRGYIDASKQTAVSIFTLPLSSTGFRNIGVVLLRSSDRLKDTQNIISYLNKNVYYGGEKDADMAWVKQRDGIIEPNYVTLFFGGDIMLDRGVRSSVMKNFNGDYSALFEKLPMMQKADIAFANLEGPASDKGRDLKNLYSFRMNPSVLPALKGAGFSIFSIANNHMGDWGREAFIDTLARLKENEIYYTGGGNTLAEAEEPVIIEKYDMKIGYLGFSDVGPDWMAAKEEQAGILLASNPRFSEIIQNASKKVDYLVVSFHFGNEYKTIHNSRQEYLAHQAIDSGARIIIGHHPHVKQDSEIYKNGIILYSLGNFIFDQHFSENTMQGILAEIKIGKDGNMTLRKDTVKLSKFYQPQEVIKGKEEKIIFEN